MPPESVETPLNDLRQPFLAAPSNQSHPDTDNAKPSLKERISEESSDYASSASEFYGNNQNEIADNAAAVIADIDVSAMKEKMKAFAESSRILMKVLDEVQTLHPFIGVVVLAFKGVVQLELKRRDNNDSVVALQVTMQDMMNDFVQSDQRLHDGVTVEDMLSTLCEAIAADIENCGNLCDKYSKTSFLGKLFKSPVYRERFSGFVQTFETRKKDLNHKLLLFTTLGIHSAGQGLMQIQETLKTNEEHINTLLRRLQSPLEQKMWNMIKDHGGPTACMADDRIMEELYSMIPGSNTMTTQSSDIGLNPLNPQIVPQPAIRLKEEMAEDLDAGLEKNMQTFRRKLREQQRQLKALERTVVSQSNRVVSVLSAALRRGPHDRVQDPELRALWMEMSWKLSVPALEFVLNLHDYHMAKYFEPTEVEDYFNHAPPDGATVEDQRVALKKALSLAKPRTEAKSALKLLSVQNTQKILEAFDSDGSGYVSVWEVNELTSACPEGWSFLQWLAYHVVGSHLTIWEYRSKICAILQQMHNLAQAHTPQTPKKKGEPDPPKYILSANKFLVNEYLDGIRNLDLILASIHPCTESLDSHLADLTAVYVQSEESRLEDILRTLDYEIDGTDTISLIIGRHQIERNLFPVLYILLKRHLEIVRQACDTVLSRHELAYALSAVRYILESVVFRISNLKASYLQRFTDPGHRNNLLSNFSFGMVRSSSVLRRFNEKISMSYVRMGKLNADLRTISSNSLHPCDTNPYTSHVSYDAIQLSQRSGISGSWSGHFRDSKRKVTAHGMMHFFADSLDILGEFEAYGSYCAGKLFVSGKEEQGGKISMTISGSPDDSIADKSLVFKVSFDAEIQVVDGQSYISGEWKTSGESGSLLFHRLPTWVHRLKFELPRQPYRVPFSKSLSKSLWKFVLSAVRYQVRLARGRLPVANIKEIRRGAELARYQYLLGNLDQNDENEFQDLLFKSTPWEARVYRCAARTSIDWTIHA
ncbi:hypothetical protein B0H11DRAFT_2251578 [Mycena galericulata]|nr:hypothetical protein B0H11DRAFT_2251578 [Mycena galericulata]